MDYKKVLRLHYVNNLSGREIADSCGDCSKSAVNEFLRRFRECQELSYPLKEDVTNEYIESLLYKKSGVSADLQLYCIQRMKREGRPLGKGNSTSRKGRERGPAAEPDLIKIILPGACPFPAY